MVEGTCYIAMELVEGSTSRDLLTAGQVPLDKGIEIAAQVADGLAMAHEAGIVHRDLKPENLMVSRDGRVKILDSGLAKVTLLTSDATETVTMENTANRGLCVDGHDRLHVSRTASGQPLDFRTDQFSFGWRFTKQQPANRRFSKERLQKVWLRCCGTIRNRFRRLTGKLSPLSGDRALPGEESRRALSLDA